MNFAFRTALAVDPADMDVWDSLERPQAPLQQLFLKAQEELLCHFRPIITHFGVTEQQWRVLRALAEMEQMEPREICEICHILSPNMTGVLSRV